MMLPPSSISGAAARADRDQRIDADVVGDAKAFARGVDEVAFQFLGRSVGHAVHERVQFAVALFELVRRVASISSSFETSHMKASAPGSDRIRSLASFSRRSF